jgi:hypothetical protein
VASDAGSQVWPDRVGLANLAQRRILGSG